MTQPVGQTLRLSGPRRFVCDLMHFAKKVPTVPMQRKMQLASVVAARQLAQPKPGWCAIFAKAYSQVAANYPELRRAYLSFPWPRLYEHPVSVASVGIERRVDDEEAVFFAHLRSPHDQSLAELDQALRRFKEAAIDKIPLFRRIQRTTQLPRPLRRLLWWWGLNISGRRRAQHFGTFGISVVASLGAAALHLLSPLTTTLNYGVIDENGEVDVRVTFDHRVLDGATVARALADLERVLKCEILAELRYMEGLEAA